MWSYVVEETGEPRENHQPWTGDHYLATCLYPSSGPGRSGDKRVFYLCDIQAPIHQIYIIGPRSDKKDLKALVKNEIFTENERQSCCEQFLRILRDYLYNLFKLV